MTKGRLAIGFFYFVLCFVASGFGFRRRRTAVADWTLRVSIAISLNFAVLAISFLFAVRFARTRFSIRLGPINSSRDARIKMSDCRCVDNVIGAIFSGKQRSGSLLALHFWVVVPALELLVQLGRDGYFLLLSLKLLVQVKCTVKVGVFLN